jgi:high-affinity K+ transport system ATPase subunit B
VPIFNALIIMALIPLRYMGLGRTRDSFVQRIMRRSFTAKMVAQAEGFALRIVSFEELRSDKLASEQEPT